MRITIKQLFLVSFIAIILVSTILLFTFILFPLNDWRFLLEKKIFNLSYLLIIVIITLVFSLILGIVTSQLWRSHLYYVERQLDQLHHGESLVQKEYNDLKKIDALFVQVQKKMDAQVEHAQRLATDKANEREKSLQEVVIQERNRLARDLHDSVSQQLFAASMMMSAINDANAINELQIQHQLHLVEKMIHQSQLEMRALLLHLRPVHLKGKALQEGIKDLLTELMDRIPVDLEYNIEEFFIEKGIEDQLFRILQEAVSNTLRHAEASSITISLIKRESFIIMRIIDNGKGFTFHEQNSSSYGLDTMKERTEDLGGTFKIISLPKQGTRIEVKIPTISEAGDYK